jgi:4-hydroxythreonine-4-phosphate dehydrogenase
VKSSNRKPVVAITMGDPCGIGPEIILKALRHDEVRKACVPVVIGSRFALERAARWLHAGTSVDLQVMGGAGTFALDDSRQDVIRLISAGGPELEEADLAPGKPSEKACRATVRSIECAVGLALEGRVRAICTGPIQKANLHRQGFPFPGHTEFLSRLTRTSDVVMMLAGPRLRIALATIHVPFASILDHLRIASLARTMEITMHGLMRDFGIVAPRLAIAALNPHAGEEGRFGDEESTLITPAIEICRERLEGLPCSLSGPFPPDSVFLRAYQGEFDAVVAMYHDQGLIPLKLVHFHEGVNVTLGMPIIRTSVDHGTAYDLTGTGKASEGSLKAAILLAAQMALNRERAEVFDRP